MRVECGGEAGKGRDRRARRAGGGSETLQTTTWGHNAESIPVASPQGRVSPYVAVNFLCRALCLGLLEVPAGPRGRTNWPSKRAAGPAGGFLCEPSPPLCLLSPQILFQLFQDGFYQASLVTLSPWWLRATAMPFYSPGFESQVYHLLQDM